MKKVYISQPMRGRATGDIIAERKRLMAEAAAALQVDDVEVLDTYPGAYTDKPPLSCWPGRWRRWPTPSSSPRAGGTPGVAGWSTWLRPSMTSRFCTGGGDAGEH